MCEIVVVVVVVEKRKRLIRERTSSRAKGDGPSLQELGREEKEGTAVLLLSTCLPMSSVKEERG